MCCTSSLRAIIPFITIICTSPASGVTDIKLDFGASGSPVQSGWTGVNDSNRLDNGTHVDLGGGVIVGVVDWNFAQSRDRGAGSGGDPANDDLLRDFMESNRAIGESWLEVRGLATGAYAVTLFVGDPDFPAPDDHIQVNGVDLDLPEWPGGGGTFPDDWDATVQVTVGAGEAIWLAKPTVGDGKISAMTIADGEPDTTAPAAVTDLSVVDADATVITIQWSAPGDDDGAGGSVASYDIRYSTATINDGTWDAATQCVGEPIPASPGQGQTFAITGLSPDTQYYVAIKSADASNNVSALSNVAVGVTDPPDVTAPAAIADLVVSGIGINSVTLTWTATGDDGSVGQASAYDVRYSTSPIVDDADFAVANEAIGEPAPQPAGSIEGFIVSGLSSDIQYYFALKVADEAASWSAMSNVVDATTMSPSTWRPTDIGSELWAWGWAGDNGGNLTLIDGPNGKLITHMTDLSGRDHHFVNSDSYRAAYQVGLTLDASVKGGPYATALPLIGLDRYSGGAQVYGNVYNHDAPLLASADFYLVTVCMNTRPNGSRELFGRSEQDRIRVDQGSDRLYMTVAGTGVTLTPDGSVPAGILLLEIARDAAGNVTAKANGETITAAPVPLPGVFTLAGEGYDGVGTSYWDDYWMEIVICEALPPAAERDALRSYLAAKWSVPLTADPDTTAPAAVTDLAVSATAPGELTLTWTAPGDDGMTGQASSYDIRYSTAPIDDGNWNVATQAVGEPSPQPAGSAESFVVTGLQADRLYWFALKTLDDAIPPNVSALSLASPLGDLDRDLDIDLDDFVLFAAAMTGPGVPTGVARADLNGDQDCDLADVAVFDMGFSDQ